MTNFTFFNGILSILPKRIGNRIKAVHASRFYSGLGVKIHVEKDYFIYNMNEISFKSYFTDIDDIGLIHPDSDYGYMKRYKIKEGDIVVDAGAYLGLFTLYAAICAGPTGRVVSFEPDPENYRKLVMNIKLNGLTNVTIINKGLYSREGTLKFNSTASGMSSIDGNGNADVNMTTLDKELLVLGIKKIDFLKMDIEGAEIEALRGCSRTLKSSRSSLAIATYHIVDGDNTSFRVERTLRSFGYDAETR